MTWASSVVCYCHSNEIKERWLLLQHSQVIFTASNVLYWVCINSLILYTFMLYRLILKHNNLPELKSLFRFDKWIGAKINPAQRSSMHSTRSRYSRLKIPFFIYFSIFWLDVVYRNLHFILLVFSSNIFIVKALQIIDFIWMWWLLKEPFLYNREPA